MTQAAERRARHRLLFAALAAVVLLALSGCFPATSLPRTEPSGVAHPISVAPLAPLVVPRVLAFCPLLDAVHYSGYPLVIDKVYICRGDEERATDGVSTYGPWEVAYRIDHPDALLAAYRAPDALKAPKVCGHFPSDPLTIWVRHDGATKAYYAPVDACGNPSDAATSAYENAKRTLLVEVDRGAPPSKKDAAG
ncbi:MAG: hypothetical protein ABIO06_02820 [Pseudolysinimonas sp.]